MKEILQRLCSTSGDLRVNLRLGFYNSRLVANSVAEREPLRPSLYTCTGSYQYVTRLVAAFLWPHLLLQVCKRNGGLCNVARTRMRQTSSSLRAYSISQEHVHRIVT